MRSWGRHCSSACTEEPTAVRSTHTGMSTAPYSSSFFMNCIIASTALRVCMSSIASGHSKEAARRKSTQAVLSTVFSCFG